MMYCVCDKNDMKFAKVFNSKLNEWYIKTLQNKEKIDNLG